jgi:hypothetical protein
MRPLSAHRQDWDERRRLEVQLLRDVTVFESVAELEALYREFGRHLEEVEADLQQERARHLGMLQGRLARLGQVQKEGAA